MVTDAMEASLHQDPPSSLKTWKLTPGPMGYQINSFFKDSSFSSLDDISLVLPYGAYTTFRTYHHSMALRMDDHFTRLNESAQRALKPTRINPDEVRTALRLVLSELEDQEDVRFRITLDLEKEPGILYISVEPLKVPPAEAYQSGVKAITKVMQRENPAAKLTGFIKNAHQIRAILPEGVNEALMMRADGLILEGLSSNFFGIRNGAMYTAEQGILAGITRSILLDICRDATIPIHREGVFLSNIYDLDEAFISSASRAVLPVVQIDQVRVGTGQPGPITQELMDLFTERIALEIEAI